jgi:hypothetical protein
LGKGTIVVDKQGKKLSSTNQRQVEHQAKIKALLFNLYKDNSEPVGMLGNIEATKRRLCCDPCTSDHKYSDKKGDVKRWVCQNGAHKTIKKLLIIVRLHMLSLSKYIIISLFTDIGFSLLWKNKTMTIMLPSDLQ